MEWGDSCHIWRLLGFSIQSRICWILNTDEFPKVIKPSYLTKSIFQSLLTEMTQQVDSARFVGSMFNINSCILFAICVRNDGGSFIQHEHEHELHCFLKPEELPRLYAMHACNFYGARLRWRITTNVNDECLQSNSALILSSDIQFIMH